mmetsp:Transcript_111185/g.313766  ORF Transcript_111185/g.313766 Transcript_111185/m.313766 type:complete len:205 (+) Transcript_111185:242-856(+)
MHMWSQASSNTMALSKEYPHTTIATRVTLLSGRSSTNCEHNGLISMNDTWQVPAAMTMAATTIGTAEARDNHMPSATPRGVPTEKKTAMHVTPADPQSSLARSVLPNAYAARPLWARLAKEIEASRCTSVDAPRPKPSITQWKPRAAQRHRAFVIDPRLLQTTTSASTLGCSLNGLPGLPSVSTSPALVVTSEHTQVEGKVALK